MWSNPSLRLLVRSGIVCHNDRLVMIISSVFNLSDTAKQQVFSFLRCDLMLGSWISNHVVGGGGGVKCALTRAREQNWLCLTSDLRLLL